METLPSLSGYVFWLLTHQETEKRIRAIMDGLRAWVEFPDFRPHVTLADTEIRNPDTLRQIADQLANMHTPIRIQSEKIDWEEHPYRCLYIKLKKNKVLMDIRQQAFRLMKKDQNAELYRPHISLVYGVLKEREKMKLGKTVDFPENTEIVLNQIAICRVSGTPDKWEIVHQSSLEQ
ncbi:MAG: hypothetical protein WD599_00165 [Balneolaceae bacterium]